MQVLLKYNQWDQGAYNQLLGELYVSVKKSDLWDAYGS